MTQWIFNRRLRYFVNSSLKKSIFHFSGGNKDSFSLDKQTANLYLSGHIEADKSQVFNLVVKATDDCWSGFWEIDENRNVVWNASDSSLLLVQVAFQEHVCAGPKFLNTWFHVGICPPYTQLGDTLLEMMVIKNLPSFIFYINLLFEDSIQIENTCSPLTVSTAIHLARPQPHIRTIMQM